MKMISKLKLAFLACCMTLGVMSAQEAIQLKSFTETSLQLEFNAQALEFVDVDTEAGKMKLPTMNGASPLLEKGAPDLQKYACSYIIPSADEAVIRLVDSKYKEYRMEVAPSKGNLLRNIDPSTIKRTFGDVYQRDAFFPANIVEAQSPHIIRDFNAQALWVYPFQYNPVTNVLRVYESMDIEVVFSNKINVPSIVDSEFESIYKNLFVNYAQVENSISATSNGNMLIISHADYMDAMQPFMDWKTQKGISNEIVDIASIGGEAALKTYVENYYIENGLTYLLFVGDHQHVPAYNHSSGYSDNYYGYIEGDDSYPEVFVGRFSSESVEDVNVQVDRVMQYEMNPVVSDNYAIGIGVASSEGPGDDGEYDFEHMRNIRDTLLGYTYEAVYEMYDGSQGGEDADGNPSASDVHALVEQGLGIINYTGHGSNNSCSSSGYNSTFVNTLTNMDVHPFFWSVACVNGNFTGTTCFAESWLRASHEGKPTGAIGTMMSTINQSWSPPMCGQDAMNEALVATTLSGEHRSFGSLSMGGCMVMNDVYGSGGATMTDTWTCFGDPSVIVRTQAPQVLTVTYDPVIPVGSTSFDVFCATEGAEVTMTNASGIISTALVENGVASLSFDALSQVEELTITVNAFNASPSIGTTSVTVLDGPWLVVTSIEFGSENGQASVNSPQTPIYFTIENIGTASTGPVYVNANGSNGVTMLTFGDNIPSIAAGESYVYTDNYFVASTWSNVTDGQEALISFTMESAEDTWGSTLSLPISSPVLEITAVDANLSFGETSTALITLTNSGSADFVGGNTTLSVDSDIVSFLGDLTIDALAAGASVILEYELTLDADAPANTQMNFELLVTEGNFEQSSDFSLVTPMCLATDLAVDLTIVTDTWGSETSWNMVDANGITINQSGSGSYESNATYTHNICAAEGTVITFNLYDSYGDGITSSEGFSIDVCGNEVVSNTGFTTEYSTSFVVSCELQIAGCTDVEAENYNAEATTDDGSCIYPFVCASGNALLLQMHDSYGDGWNGNYFELYSLEDSLLLSHTLADGSEGVYEFCLEDGCYSIITTDAGSYTYEVSWELMNGTDTLATGVSPSSTSLALNADCGFVYGCTDATACNYDETANVDDASCEYAQAYYNCDGSCISDIDADGYCDELEVYGCTDVEAINYNAEATEEDNSCEYATDCTDNFVLLNMSDSYGDGWNGNILYITNAVADTIHTVSLATGSAGSESFCLADGCYVFNTSDEGSWSYEVSWELLDANGNAILSGTAPSVSGLTLGDITCDFSGCTDASAINFDANALEDDGSCVYDDCICIDLWDPVCGSDGITYGNSCEADCVGVSYTAGECSNIIYGCTDPTANNYNADATSDDGTCTYEEQGPWDITITGSNHTIVVGEEVQVFIEDMAIENGDWFGVFYTDDNGELQCAGALMWDGQTNAIAAQGDDTTTDAIDGMSNGEEFQWMIWDASENVAYLANATYLTSMPNQENYVTNGISALGTLESTPAITEQLIELNAGWNLFSSYMLSENMDMAAVVAPVYGDIIIVKDNAGLAYLPDWNFNGIGDMQVGQGYQIKMAAAQSLLIEGEYMSPEENPIVLTEGWNMFGALRLEASDVVAVFADLIEHVVIVKDEQGLAYLPEWNFNGIGDIVAGKGYQAKMSSTQTLQYLSNDASYRTSFVEVTENNLSNYAKVAATGNNMTVIIEEAAWDVVPAEGSEIAAFDKEGKMIGAAVYNSPVTVLTLWGDDATTKAKDGLAISELASFKVWSKGSTATFEVREWLEGSSAYNVDAINIAAAISTENAIADLNTTERVLVKVINVLGQELVNADIESFQGKVLFKVYSDGSVEKIVY